jgi:hypothetical protein
VVERNAVVYTNDGFFSNAATRFASISHRSTEPQRSRYLAAISSVVSEGRGKGAAGDADALHCAFIE